ncbi:amidohydrolase family protein [Modestobacter sp. VKM Ac-2979]|uniref:N-acetylglucosamine-6-phosphate deacetylase n=1 Tax=unclassified Modestobacter TaxID=2643866 RepID=UPI0022AB539A|nr:MULTISPECIES: amidohydrolase family protein [unclassified Modestobacter]MCZ2810810.1 amidohydrolase family protein [Modestobacter sp. VKM Ac-2979]MCZ2840323.1 amidohydrolase family protein [Modestobacter sp. VKM Ac-2980]
MLRGRLVTGGSVVDDGVLAVVGDRVAFAGPAADWTGELPPPAPGTLLLPGLVDLHCHGAAGHGFPDADAAGVRAAAAHHRAHGTTTLVASLVSAPAAVLRERLAVLAPLVEAGELAGVHLEGPFLSAARCGAQDPAALVPGDPALLAELLAAGRGAVVSMTLAPETAHRAELVDLLRAHGAVPSFGHTDAAAAEVTAAIRSAAPGGPLSATHLFNGMPPLLSRAPGPVAACLAAAARGELVVELIGDGVHLAPETVATVFDLVGPGAIALVTDAMAAAGMADGSYRLGSLPVEVRDGVARLTGASAAIAGGTARLVDVVRATVAAGVPLADAVRSATATPARLLGREDVGELAPGRRADVLVTDLDLSPTAVLRAGAWVHREES